MNSNFFGFNIIHLPLLSFYLSSFTHHLPIILFVILFSASLSHFVLIHGHILRFLKYLFIYFWLRWVFVAAHGLSLVAASGGYSLWWCAGFSLQWLLLLPSMGSRHAGFRSCGMGAPVVVACGFSSCGSRVLEHRLSSCATRA